MNPVSFSRVTALGKKSLRCYPDSGIALGSRWLAFASLDGFSDDVIDEPYSTLEVAKDVGNRVASSIASGVLSISSMYMGSEEQVVVKPTDSQLEKEKMLANAVGNVAIYDVVEDKILYRFKCHKDPIAHLAFDQSGTLLCTASITGFAVNVIKLETKIKRENGRKTISLQGKLLYRLIRGQTTGTITRIQFTSDSKWVSVCTAKGTTHLFAINPDGKPVTTRTHTPIGEIASPSYIYDEYTFNPTPPALQHLYAKARIRVSAEDEILPNSFCCEFLPGKSRKILLMTPQGCLQQFQMQPSRTYNTDDEPELKLETIPEQEWELIRKSNASSVAADFTSAATLTNRTETQTSISDNNWASYSENQTFDNKYVEHKKMMITKRNLFHFQTYDEEGSEELLESVMMSHKQSFVFFLFFSLLPLCFVY